MPINFSYSCYYSHTVFVTREGRIYAIGNNYKSIISSTLPKEPISVMCEFNFTLYLVIDPENKKLNKLIYASKNQSCREAKQSKSYYLIWGVF